jgi:hypothetical protein
VKVIDGAVIYAFVPNENADSPLISAVVEPTVPDVVVADPPEYPLFRHVLMDALDVYDDVSAASSQRRQLLIDCGANGHCFFDSVADAIPNYGVLYFKQDCYADLVEKCRLALK